MNTPDPCDKCAPFGGEWMETDSGLRRCDCERGKSKREAEKVPPARLPVLKTENAMMFVEMMSSVEFFPSSAGARALIADEIASMCESDERALWLTKRIVRLYQKWPGLIELRRVYCSKNWPLDSLPAIGISEYYPDGIPSETNRIESTVSLVSGCDLHQISASPSLAATVSDLAEKTKLSRALDRRPSVPVRDIPIRKLNPGDVITWEQVAECEAEMQKRKASTEAGIE